MKRGDKSQILRRKHYCAETLGRTPNSDTQDIPSKGRQKRGVITQRDGTAASSLESKYRDVADDRLKRLPGIGGLGDGPADD